MVLISIHPFPLRKIFLVIVAFLCFSALCFADPVLMVRRYASHTERLVVVSAATPTTWQEPARGLRFGMVNPYFARVELADLAEHQPGAVSNDRGKTDPLPVMLSSVFRKASCALQSAAPAPLRNEPTLGRWEPAERICF